MNDLMGFWKKLPIPLLLLFWLVGVILIGLIYYFTGSEFAFSLFFLFPVFMSAWFIGRWAGIFLSLVSTLVWLLADLLNQQIYTRSFVPFVNEIFRLLVFLIFTEILVRFKLALARETEYAREDSLTGIPNRRNFFEVSIRELNRAKRNGEPLSMAYIDMDNFKSVNDMFGHKTGDQVLIKVAQTLQDNARDVDVISRIGGDEFVILMAETDENESYKVIERLKIKLSEVASAYDWPITFSVGLVTYLSPPETIEAMLKFSDEIMYNAKSSGKNCTKHIVIDPEGSVTEHY